MNYEEKFYDHNFEPHECVILLQSKKIGKQANKDSHSISEWI